MTRLPTTIPWWYRRRAQKDLESWTHPLIQPRVYLVRFDPGKGCFVDFTRRLISIDPLLPDCLKSKEVLPVKLGRTSIKTVGTFQMHWSQMTAWHEDFHVLFTDPVPTGGILHWLVNSLEDERIERIARWYYPPAWAAFLSFGSLLAQHFTVLELKRTTRAQVLLNACLYMRWDWKRPRGTPSRYHFHDEEEEKFWKSDVFPLVMEAWSAESEAKVVELAREILHRIGIPEATSVAAVGVLLAPNGFDTLGTRDEADLALVSPIGAGSPASSSGPFEVQEGELPPVEPLDPPSEVSAEEELYLLPPQHLTSEVRGDVNRLLHALRVPTPEVEEEEEEPHGTEWSFEDFVQTRGGRPFRTPAEEGRAPGGLAIVLLIDTTTSMGGWSGQGLDERGLFNPDFYKARQRMTGARELAMLFELVCYKANIPLSIGSTGDSGFLYHLPKRKDRNKPEQPVSWLRSFDTARDAEEPGMAIAGLYGKYGRECVSPALRLAQTSLAERREATKVIIFVHDGIPTDEGKKSIIHTLEAIRKKGTLVFAPYVGEQSGIGGLQSIFGHEWTIPAPTRHDLITRVSRLLLKYARASSRH